eukprot:4510420-Pyramimonas_sp.AAC.1
MEAMYVRAAEEAAYVEKVTAIKTAELAPRTVEEMTGRGHREDQWDRRVPAAPADLEYWRLNSQLGASGAPPVASEAPRRTDGGYYLPPPPLGVAESSCAPIDAEVAAPVAAEVAAP